MSEEKLYMVKNDEGSYITVTNGLLVHWHENSGDLFSSYQEASKLATTLGGHVVTLIEEPEKVVLTKKQAEIVENAHDSGYPATEIFSGTDSGAGEERLLINAYVNGYTVANEKEYNVKVPHTSFYYWKKLDGGLSVNDLVANDKYDAMKFTEAEIEHYGLQDCEKVWCDSDD